MVRGWHQVNRISRAPPRLDHCGYFADAQRARRVKYGPYASKSLNLRFPHFCLTVSATPERRLNGQPVARANQMLRVVEEKRVKANEAAFLGTFGSKGADIIHRHAPCFHFLHQTLFFYCDNRHCSVSCVVMQLRTLLQYLEYLRRNNHFRAVLNRYTRLCLAVSGTGYKIITTQRAKAAEHVARLLNTGANLHHPSNADTRIKLTPVALRQGGFKFTGAGNRRRMKNHTAPFRL
ncbi:hypothetical protein HOS07_gp37 [Cronobacter phage ESSI-2]|uniref:Uncharacterized protein n=1 Tax=Cronobacter phage ESSI-2 TaxID=947842 RepID=F1BUN3_9CAUD|nr:hypothetical protein HOS07_gp37 [Cronobacter phage ESSI-2]ADX32383.1 hypothetical protein [Cronobacter phage ESSI-2]